MAVPKFRVYKKKIKLFGKPRKRVGFGTPLNLHRLSTKNSLLLCTFTAPRSWNQVYYNPHSFAKQPPTPFLVWFFFKAPYIQHQILELPPLRQTPSPLPKTTPSTMGTTSAPTYSTILLQPKSERVFFEDSIVKLIPYFEPRAHRTIITLLKLIKNVVIYCFCQEKKSIFRRMVEGSGLGFMIRKKKKTLLDFFIDLFLRLLDYLIDFLSFSYSLQVIFSRTTFSIQVLRSVQIQVPRRHFIFTETALIEHFYQLNIAWSVGTHLLFLKHNLTVFILRNFPQVYGVEWGLRLQLLTLNIFISQNWVLNNLNRFTTPTVLYLFQKAKTFFFTYRRALIGLSRQSGFFYTLLENHVLFKVECLLMKLLLPHETGTHFYFSSYTLKDEFFRYLFSHKFWYFFISRNYPHNKHFSLFISFSLKNPTNTRTSLNHPKPLLLPTNTTTQHYPQHKHLCFKHYSRILVPFLKKSILMDTYKYLNLVPTTPPLNVSLARFKNSLISQVTLGRRIIVWLGGYVKVKKKNNIRFLMPFNTDRIIKFLLLFAEIFLSTSLLVIYNVLIAYTVNPPAFVEAFDYAANELVSWWTGYELEGIVEETSSVLGQSTSPKDLFNNDAETIPVFVWNIIEFLKQIPYIGGNFLGLSLPAFMLLTSTVLVFIYRGLVAAAIRFC